MAGDVKTNEYGDVRIYKWIGLVPNPVQGTSQRRTAGHTRNLYNCPLNHTNWLVVHLVLISLPY